MPLRFGELGISLLSMAVGAVFYYFSLDFPAPASEGDLGPAFFPRMLCVLLMLLGFIQAVYSLKHSYGDAKISGSTVAKVLVGIILCSIYVYLIPMLGYFYAVLLFSPLLLIYQGYKNILWVLAITAGSMAMAYGVFYRFLAVPLPL